MVARHSASQPSLLRHASPDKRAQIFPAGTATATATAVDYELWKANK